MASHSGDYLETLPMPDWMAAHRGESLALELDSDDGIAWNLDAWEAAFSRSEWQALWPRFETVSSWSVDGYIRRMTLLQEARLIDSGDALTLHIGAMVWGVGSTTGRNRANVAKGLKDSNAPVKMSRLFEALRTSGFSIEIFNRIGRKGDLGLPGLGSSFATKTLYFMGFGLDHSADLRPLILDMVVARALRETAPAFPKYPGFRRKWYSSYVRLAQRWGDELGFPTRPDVIEYLLFWHGKQ